jgi:hypothetical protein
MTTETTTAKENHEVMSLAKKLPEDGMIYS